MDVVSAKVLGTLALVGGVVFLVTSVARVARPDVDLVLVALNSVFGIVLVVAGIRLWGYARRKSGRSR